MSKDEVFDLFGLLCTERNKWKWYSPINSGGLTHLGFDAASEQETRECREVAESAYRLITALTGYKLLPIMKSKTSFVDFALGFNHTDFTSLDVKTRKVSTPTINLKELMKIIVGEKDDPNWKKDIETVLGKMNSNVYLQPNCPMALHLLLPSDSVTVLEFGRYGTTSDGTTKVTSADFEGLEHCFVCTTSNDYSFYAYLWDETATAYELAGSEDNFIKIIKNKGGYNG